MSSGGPVQGTPKFTGLQQGKRPFTAGEFVLEHGVTHRASKLRLELPGRGEPTSCDGHIPRGGVHHADTGEADFREEIDIGNVGRYEPIVIGEVTSIYDSI